METKACDYCPQKSIAHKLCWRHLKRFYRHGDPMIVLPKTRPIIKVCKFCSAERNKDVKIGACLDCWKKYRSVAQKRFRKNNLEHYRELWRNWYKRNSPYRLAYMCSYNLQRKMEAKAGNVKVAERKSERI